MRRAAAPATLRRTGIWHRSFPRLGSRRSATTGAERVPRMAGPAPRWRCWQGCTGGAFGSRTPAGGCAPAASGCGVTARAAGSRRWPRQAHLTYLPARTWQPMKACWKMRPHSSGISISAPRFLSYGSRCSRSMARPTAGFPELGRDPGEPLNSGQRHGAALSRRHGGRIRPRVPADLDWSQAEGPGTRVGGGSQDLGRQRALSALIKG